MAEKAVRAATARYRRGHKSAIGITHELMGTLHLLKDINDQKVTGGATGSVIKFQKIKGPVKDGMAYGSKEIHAYNREVKQVLMELLDEGQLLIEQIRNGDLEETISLDQTLNISK